MHTVPMRGIAVLAPLALALGLLSCADAPTRVVPDTVPPRIGIVFPRFSDPATPASFDRDSNHLMDLELHWSDSLGPVDPGTLRIVARGGVPGAAPDSNLARGWRRVRLDSAGAAFEETLALLLPAAATTLVVSVADSAGHVGTDSVVVQLEPGFYQRSISLSYRPEWPQVRGVNLALLPDGSKGIAPFEGARVAIFDPEGVIPTHWVENVPSVLFGTWASIDPATGLAYLGGGGGLVFGLTVFDVRAERVVRWTLDTVAVVSVIVNGDRLYVGEACSTGRILVYDKTSWTQVGIVDPQYPDSGGSCNNPVVRSFSSDGSIGWARVVNHGVLSFDGSFHLQQTFPLIGEARDVRLVDDARIYLARLESGLDERDAVTGSLTSRYAPSGPLHPDVKELAISPDHRMLFASASAGSVYPDIEVRAPLLFDIPGLHLRWAFPHRPGGLTDAAVWHPDGKRVFMMSDYQVDVYVVRP